MAKTPDPAYDYCEHGRMGDACEDCAYAAAKERGAALPGPAPEVTRKAQEAADAGADSTTAGAASSPAPRKAAAGS